MRVEFNTNKGRKKAELIKSNVKTVWVKLEKQGKVIKRHRIKHNVV